MTMVTRIEAETDLAPEMSDAEFEDMQEQAGDYVSPDEAAEQRKVDGVVLVTTKSRAELLAEVQFWKRVGLAGVLAGIVGMCLGIAIALYGADTGTGLTQEEREFLDFTMPDFTPKD